MLLIYSQYNNTSHQHIGISILKSTIARQIIPSGELTGFNLMFRMDMTGNFVKLTPIHSPSKWSADYFRPWLIVSDKGVIEGRQITTKRYTQQNYAQLSIRESRISPITAVESCPCSSTIIFISYWTQR